MQSAGIPCDRCHVREAERYVVFRQNLGWVAGHTATVVAGGLCATCRREAFARTTLTTLVAGWWSPSSLLLAPLVLASNVYNLLGGAWDPPLLGEDREAWRARRDAWNALQRVAPDDESTLATGAPDAASPDEETAETDEGAAPISTIRETPDDAPPGARTALLASARFFGDIVEETFVERGGTVQIGNSGAMGVPVPEGWPFLARVHWVGPHRAVVEDHEGREHPLERGERVSMAAGPVALDLRLVPRYALRRTEDLRWWGSMAWFAVVFAATLLSMQGGVVAEHSCDWFGLFCPPPAQTSAGTSGMYTAEYLARLLEKDYAGDEHGALQKQKHEKAVKRVPSYYIPAGAAGPITKMGGAAEEAPEAIRAPPPKEDPAPPAARHEKQPKLASDAGKGTPVPSVDDTPEPESAQITDGDGEADAQDAQAPAEDKKGWGVEDWYDAQDKKMEQLEIDLMLRSAKQRLRIDPNDPDALSVLSYYQYLAEDFNAAEKTYDKFISLYPDEAAGYNNKALIFKRLGRYKKEEGLYRVALALAPDDPTALNNLAVCLAHQGRFNEALAIMKHLEKIDPDDPYADLHRAKIHAAMGDDEVAYQYLEQALQGMADLDTLHHIEFRQDIRVDPAFAKLRQTRRFHAILTRYYGNDSPLQE